MFFPIILNISVLTISVGFAGTWVITSLMMLACLYLVCWEYDRLKPLIFENRGGKSQVSKHWLYLLPASFAICGAFIFAFFAYFHVANLHQNLFAAIPIVITGFIFGTVCYLHVKFMRAGKLENTLRTIE